MKNLSRFDITMIIAFVVIGLIGGGVAYYLDAYKLADSLNDVQAANDDFQKYSSKQPYLPTEQTVQVLQKNNQLTQAQLDPLVKKYFLADGNKLPTINNVDTIAWKHQLDDIVSKLNADAKVHGIKVPKDYYYGFSRYLSQNPSNDDTEVLSKQLLAVEQMVDILIGAPVNAITHVRRTAEENGLPNDMATGKVGDYISGHSVDVDGGLYTAYPFEIDFDTTTDPFRKVVRDLMQSPYIFVIRSISVQNEKTISPQISQLDTIAGSISSASVTDSSPGAVASAQPVAGPQYLFGGEILHVQARVDLIDWKGLPSDSGNQ
jgi:hypothetical protein